MIHKINDFKVEFKKGSVYVNGERVYALGVAAGYFYRNSPESVNENVKALQSLVKEHGSIHNNKRFAVK